MNKALLVSALASHAAHAIKNCISPREEPEMTTLSKEDVVQLIEELGAGSNWLSGKHNVYSYNRQPKIAAMFLKAFAEQGLLELIAELRKPHNWKIEGFGHFKDVKMHQSDAPFRAASALEHFAALARADLVAENERLSSELSKHEAIPQYKEARKAEVAVLREQLAVTKAENDRLRAIIEKQSDCEGEFCGKCYEQGLSESRTALAAAEARETKLREALSIARFGQYLKSELAAIDAVLAQPRDDSALREMIAGVYEECAKACEDDAKGWTDYSCEMAARDCVDAIRALAEQAKEKKC